MYATNKLIWQMMFKKVFLNAFQTYQGYHWNRPYEVYRVRIVSDFTNVFHDSQIYFTRFTSKCHAIYKCITSFKYECHATHECKSCYIYLRTNEGAFTNCLPFVRIVNKVLTHTHTLCLEKIGLMYVNMLWLITLYVTSNGQ